MSRAWIRRCMGVAVAGLMVAGVAPAGTIFVGGDREAGKAAAAAAGGRWVKSLSKAFAKAGVALQSGGPAEVEIRLATGTYTGDLGSGAYTLPRIVNPEASLRVSGGWSADFSTRDPFHHPSVILATPQRSAPLWTIPRGSKLAALVVDGLLWDAAPSNAYDARSNSLLPGKSCSFKFVQFNYLETNRLEFDNCVFVNSAARVMEPLIRAATPQAVIRFDNCIFLNNRIPLKLDSARFRHKPARIEVTHCSFLLNWPYNPDPGTGNRGALEIGPADAAQEVHITHCLFWANIGGAIQAGFTKLPALFIEDNDFVGNGLLHGRTEPDASAMIVTVGGHFQDIPVDMIEDVPAVDEAEGNVSIPPDIPLSIGEPTFVDSSKVRAKPGWNNEVRRILGLNLQGGRVAITDYAPRKKYDPEHPPVPRNPKAAAYGAQPAAAH